MSANAIDATSAPSVVNKSKAKKSCVIISILSTSNVVEFVNSFLFPDVDMLLSLLGCCSKLAHHRGSECNS